MGASGTGTKGRHIVDPRTGQLADRYRAVWVLAPTAIEADALSTAFMAMTPDEIETYCQTHPEVSAMLVGPGRKGAQGAMLRFGRW
jgi:thiamine biosynthesis lipoprotein